MPTTLGDLSVGLLLDLKPFGEGVKSALNLLSIFEKQAKDILSLKGVKPNLTPVDTELKKLDQTLDKYQKEVKETSQAHTQLDSSLDKSGARVVTLSDKFQNIAFRVEGFRAVMSVLQSTMGNLVQEYNKQEVALAKLENGLKNVGEGSVALHQLTQQASELQKITPFADEEITNAQAMLTTFQKNSEQIGILTPRMLDLAAAYMKSGETGMDLQQVAVLLGKVNDETIGGLKRVGVAFSQEQEEKLKSLKGTEQTIYLSQILDQNFKGMAVTVGQTAAGQMKIFQNQTGEAKEALGKILSEGLLPFLKLLTPLVQMIAEGSESTKLLTIAVLGLATAFVILNTSMGGIPYILGAIVTVLADVYNKFKATGSIVEATKLDFSDFGSSVISIMKQLLFPIAQVTFAVNRIKDAIDDTIIRWRALKEFDLGTAFEPGIHKFPEGEAVDERQENINFANAFHEVRPKEPIDTTPKVKTTSSGPSASNEEEKELDRVASKEKEVAKKRAEYDDAKLKGHKGLMFTINKEIEALDKEIKIMKEGFDEFRKITSEAATVTDDIKPFKIEPTNEFELAIFKQKQATEEAAKSYDKILSDLQAASSLVSAISGKLSAGGKDFFYWINAALQAAIKIYQVSNNKGGIGLGDVLGVLGTVLPFFLADGGRVPGSGSGDSVPAMLTPGEFVIRKSIAEKMPHTLAWLNGGGTVLPMNYYKMGMGVNKNSNVTIQVTGELTDHLKWKIVNDGIKIVNIKNDRTTFN